MHCGAVCCYTALVPYSFILHFPNRFAIFIKMGKIVPPERSRTMELYKKTYRVSKEAKRMVEEIAAKENCTETAVFENAIRCYRDYLYVQNNGAFITESVKRTVLASVNLMESRLNNRTNKVLSELAIQQAILCQVIAHELEVNPRALDNYRRAAVEYLKMNDRVFRLEDIVEE